jgi:hypothetical protein
VAAQAGKRRWLVAISEAYDGRSGIEATVEPYAVKGRNQGAKMPDEAWGERGSG